ncbi:acyltransferase family protein [Mariniflexile aquimaris]|uniref:Acyltransferase family protein n=1 Tax=Mariniflexile aquimaris TaxID=881009 RepID=A0ABW3BW22_9FLAO
MKRNNKEIIPWIDVIKGFGILSVVIGHIFNGVVSHIMFIFHMPLFFFISGYLLKPTSEFSQYFKKKVVHLLIPYFCFLIPLYLFFTGLPPIALQSFLDYITTILYGGVKLHGALGVFWFITCLFLTQQTMNYLIVKLKTKILILIISVILVFSYINMVYFPNLYLPWNAHVVLASAPIFYLGFLFKNKNIKIKNSIFLLIGCSVMIFSYFYPENVYDMKTTNYGIPLVTLLSSIVLVLNLKIISIKLSNFKWPKLMFSEIGKASMVIMYLHQPIQFLTSSYISESPLFRFLITIIVSCLIYRIFLNFKISRSLFLGSYQDFKKIQKCFLKKINI